MQSILMAVSAAALLHTTMVSSGPMIPDGPSTGPMPQNGVWALLPDKCDQPTSLDMTTWPKCATPVGFLDDEVAALEKPGPGKKATPDEFYSVARTRYAVTPATPAQAARAADTSAPVAPATTSAPTPAPQAAAVGAPAPALLVAQVVVPMVFSRSYYYIAISPKELDDTGHFAEARGWPVACSASDKGGCNPKTLADVQAQATIEPTDPQRLYRLVRILPSPADATAPTPLAPKADGLKAAPAPGTLIQAPLPPAKDMAPGPAPPAASPGVKLSTPS